MRFLPTFAALALLASCGGDDASDPTNNPGTGTATGTTGTLIPPTVSCAQDPDNLLRVACEAQTAAPEVVHFLWSRSGGLGEHHWPGDLATVHRMTMWGLKDGATYTLYGIGEAGQTEETVTASSLPAGWQAGGVVTGGSQGETVLTTLPCAPEPTLVLVDTDGLTVGYQPLPGTEITAYSWTRDDTFLAVVDRDRIVEYDLLGNELLSLSASGGDFVGPAHRDVQRGPAGLTWVLTAERVVDNSQEYVVDKLVVFNRMGNQLGEWRLADHLAPFDPANDSGSTYWAATWPDAIDYSQGSSLWVDDVGDVIVAFANLHTVMKIRGNPLGTDFGQVLWRLGGGALATEPSDLQITSDSGVANELDFSQPLSVVETSDGLLGVMDGRAGLAGNSRALFFELDPGAGTADIVEAFDLGAVCGTGSAASFDGPRRIATCGSAGATYEYELGRNGPQWSFEPSCGVGMTRVLPVALPWELQL